MFLNILCPKASDQRYPTCFVGWIQFLNNGEDVINIMLWANFHPQGIKNPTEKLDMGSVNLTGPITDPKHMAGAIIPAAFKGVLTGQGLFVAKK